MGVGGGEEKRRGRDAHLVELLVDLVVVFVVLDELYDECPVGQGEELCIDLRG